MAAKMGCLCGQLQSEDLAKHQGVQRNDISNLKDLSTTMTKSHVAKANCNMPLTLARLSTTRTKINAVNVTHLATHSRAQ
jgi:hypothetical protein